MSLISKADFVAVPSTDWRRSRAFYVDTLGLRPDATGDAEFWSASSASGSTSRRPSGWSSRRSGPPTSRCTSTTSSRPAQSSRRRASSSSARPSTRASATWRSSRIPTATRSSTTGTASERRRGRSSAPTSSPCCHRHGALDRLLRRDARASARPRRGLAEFQLGENVSLYLVDPTNIGREFEGPHTRRSRCASRTWRRRSTRSRRRASVRRRDVRHRRLPHGDLPRPRTATP